MAKAALLIMDCQQGILSLLPNCDTESYAKNVAAAAQRARSAGVQVIHVNVAFRPGFPEVHPQNKFIGALAAMGKASGQFVVGDPSVDFDPALAPESEDIVVTKKRVSAFAGSDLEVVLRSLGIESLALAGVATSGVVLSTLRQAADLDFVVTVLEDLVRDPDEEVHRVLMEKVFPLQATVCSSSKWLESLAQKN